jgi:long-subunit acyl-CoA synthetase (AMP-forming)
LCLLPLSTLLENIGGIYMPLLAGGSSVLVDPHELGMEGSSRLCAQRFLEAIERHQPNTMILVPQLLSVLDTALQSGWCPPESLQFVAVGGARVAAEMIERVRGKGLPVYEGYGLSESASVVSLNTARHNRPGTSGKVLPHVTVVSRAGELEVSGNAFLGYLDQEDSWGVQTIQTGDVGHIDSDGYITVEGRSKNVLISSYGRNISPEWVESELMASGIFFQVLVLGDGRPYCTALLLPTDPHMSEGAIDAAVIAANNSLPDYARVGNWLRLDRPICAEQGLLTENGRPRRDNIQAHFALQIEQLYFDQAETMSL